MSTRWFKSWIHLYLNAFNILNPRIQSANTVLLGRSHVDIQEFHCPPSKGTCGARRMELLGKSSKSLRPLLLMVHQVILVVQISIFNNKGVVRRIKKISYSPNYPDAEGIDELDGEEAELINPLASHSSRSSSTNPPAKKFHSHIIPSNPKKFQPVLSSLPSSIPPPLPKFSTSRPVLASPMKPSPVPQPRPSPNPTSQKLQPVASTRQR
ncbi:hypothetical protein O181_046797 [Austropuccinia psidii MF-1]|uniref:Uncharacterized protein n=1 Tax=Austropuccinia psidii MF-1 TaxID=1389203 RepID=A0A9Q3DS03_9BASI|nr:hypothetical protein [Austropuccinia psidii MF-1]